jgi:hypothetical protein
MREALQQLNGQRLQFTAIVERFGTRKSYLGYPQPTILLRQVVALEAQTLVTDHLWFIVRKTIAALDLQPGERIQFEARVTQYTKGYVNRRAGIDDRTIDYKLERPTKFIKITT